MEILQQMPDFWLTIGHIHGKDIMFEKLLDYPFQMVNWHDQETPPSLAEAQRMFKGTLIGGLRQEETMMLGTPEDVLREKTEAIHATHGERFILGTGCVLPVTSPIGNILAAKSAIM
jgi:uroporphyrinogen decarboxylase